MLRHISLGPASFQTAPLIFIISFMFFIEITRRVSHKNGLKEETVSNSLFFGMIGAIFGARIGYVVLHWAAYDDNLQEAFAPSLQALDFSIGLIVFALLVMSYNQLRGIPLRPFLDSAAPSMGVVLAIIPFAFLADGTVFGQPTDLPWRIELWSEYRHPTQIYAVAGSLITLGIWSRLPRYFVGQGLIIIVAGNAITWLLVGFLLAEPSLTLNYRTVQILAWLTLIVAAFLWGLWEPESDESRAAPQESSVDPN